MRPITDLAILTIASALAATLLAPPAQAAGAGQYATSARAATNDVRAARGRVALKEDACLTRLARRHAARMAAQRRVFHQSIDAAARRCAMAWAGENVAAGYATGRSTVRQGWMKSPPHRRNLMLREYRQVGLGAERGRDGRWYVAQLLGRRG